jgi:hypothetical protein
MKYLNSRDNYLKSINERRIVENNNKIDTSINKLILENVPGSGALGNEIKWGDSLLGRLINHIMRKVGIGASIVRMQPLIARLKSEFDNIAVEASINELTDAQKEQFALLAVFSILNKLENTVLNLHIKKTPLSEIKVLTDSAIDFVEKTENVPDKNQLLQKLNAWKKFIDGLKLEEFEEKETKADKDSKSLYEFSLQNLTSVLNIVKIYDEMMKKKFYIAAPDLAASESGTPGATASAPTPAPDIATKDPEVDKKYQELLAIWQAEQKKLGKNTNAGEGTRVRLKKEAEHAVKVDKKAKELLVKWREEQKKLGKNTREGEGTRARIKKEAELAVKESLIFEEITIDPNDPSDQEKNKHARYAGDFGGNKQVGNAKQNPDGTVQWDFKNSKNINAVVKSLYSYFKSDVDAINELGALLKMTPEQRAESGKKVKTPIEKIYGLVRKKFNAKDSNDVTYKENLDSFLTKPEAIAEKINNLYSVTVKTDVMKAVNDEIAKNFKNNQNLALWEKMKQELVNFNSTMRGVLEPDLQFGKSSAESEDKKESLMKYSQFMKVFEADYKGTGVGFKKDEPEATKPEATKPEATKPEATKPEETPTEDSQSDVDSDDNKGKPKELMNKNIINKIQDYWSKKMDLKAWVLDETQVEKIRENLEVQLASKKDSYKIRGIDPIINILKLFNRAYKLHTTDVIPGGRSDGAVDRYTYNEYTAFGSGSTPNAIANGPYRHKKTFNMWEDAVLDIMADRKYQPIFDPKTEVIVGDKVKEGGGTALRKMMTDLLDGDNLYKGDSKDAGSAQKKMLDRYFGDIEDFSKIDDGKLSFPSPDPGKDGKPTNDLTGNSQLANKIEDLKYVFDTTEELKESSVIKDKKYKGSFFQIKGKNESNEDSTLYCFVQEYERTYLYLVYSRSFYYFKKYIENQGGGSPTFDKGDSGANLRLGKDEKLLYGTAILFEDFNQILNKKIAKIQLNSVSSDAKNPVLEEKVEFEPSSVYWLANITKGEAEEGKDATETKTVYTLSDAGKLKNSIDTTGGFPKILELTNKKYKDGKFSTITKKA